MENSIPRPPCEALGCDEPTAEGGRFCVEHLQKYNSGAGVYLKSDAPPVEPSATEHFSDVEFRPGASEPRTMAAKIAAVCDTIKAMLLVKNQSYGNSAAEPIRIFSKATALEAINVRIDDKLSRIAKGHEYGQEDTELDLIGYLILKRAMK